MDASFSPDSPSDHELVAKFKTGDTEAFDSLLKRYYPAVERFFRARLTGDRSLAEDLAQETFLHVAVYIDQLKDDLAFRGWLFTIARNTLVSDRRARKRRISAGSLDAFEAAHDTLRVLSYLDRWIEGFPERDLFDRALSTVHPPYQVVLRLRHRDGCSASEIGAFLGVEEGAARKRTLRAEAQFRQRFDAELLAMREEIEEHAAAV